VADVSDLKVQLTLTLGEMRTLVGLINFAEERLGGDVDDATATLVEEVSGMYFELMENLKDGRFDDFELE
jgi:hypothetical protein